MINIPNFSKEEITKKVLERIAVKSDNCSGSAWLLENGDLYCTVGHHLVSQEMKKLGIIKDFSIDSDTPMFTFMELTNTIRVNETGNQIVAEEVIQQSPLTDKQQEKLVKLFCDDNKKKRFLYALNKKSLPLKPFEDRTEYGEFEKLDNQFDSKCSVKLNKIFKDMKLIRQKILN